MDSSYIRYQTIGTTPNRKFIVSYYVKYYNCSGSNKYTDFQIVLFETTNIIRINVAAHPGCSGYISTQGMSNYDNSKWIGPPNRNNKNWGGTVNSSV